MQKFFSFLLKVSVRSCNSVSCSKHMSGSVSSAAHRKAETGGLLSLCVSEVGGEGCCVTDG